MANLRTVHFDLPGASKHIRAKSTEELSRPIPRLPALKRSQTWVSSREKPITKPFGEVTVQFKAKRSKLPKKGKQGFLCWRGTPSKEQEHSSDEDRADNKGPEREILREPKKESHNKRATPEKGPKSVVPQGPPVPIPERDNSYQLFSEQGRGVLKAQPNTNSKVLTELRIEDLKRPYRRPRGGELIPEGGTLGQIFREPEGEEVIQRDIAYQACNESSTKGPNQVETNNGDSFGELPRRDSYPEKYTKPQVCREEEKGNLLQENSNRQVNCSPKSEVSSQREENDRLLYKERLRAIQRGKPEYISDYKRLKSKEKKMDFEPLYPRDLKESGEMISRLQESLFREKKIAEAKERTIQNMKQEIRILDNDLIEKNRENVKLSEQLSNGKCRMLSMETENRILANQVRMYEESNRRIYKAHMELRNKFRKQEAKMEEMKMQRYDAERNFQKTLEESIERQNRFRKFLQQLETEMSSRDLANEKMQSKGRSVVDILRSDAATSEDKGLAHPVGTSDLVASVKEARDQMNELEEMVVVDTALSKHIAELVRGRMVLIEEEMKRLNRELGTSKLAKQDGIKNLNNMRTFSFSEDRMRKLNKARISAQEQQAELDKSICNLESKPPSATGSEQEILNLNQRMAAAVQENLALTDDLTEAHKSLSALENAYNATTKQHENLTAELSQKDKELVEAETNLVGALAKNTALQMEVARMEKELQKVTTESERGSRDRTTDEQTQQHRVEKPFPPGSTSKELINNESEKCNYVEDDGQDPKHFKQKKQYVRKEVLNDNSDKGTAKNPLPCQDRNKLEEETFREPCEENVEKTLVIVKEIHIPALESLGTDFVDSAENAVNKEIQSSNGVDYSCPAGDNENEITRLRENIKTLNTEKDEVNKLNRELMEELLRMENEMSSFTTDRRADAATGTALLQVNTQLNNKDSDAAKGEKTCPDYKENDEDPKHGFKRELQLQVELDGVEKNVNRQETKFAPDQTPKAESANLVRTMAGSGKNVGLSPSSKTCQTFNMEEIEPLRQQLKELELSLESMKKRTIEAEERNKELEEALRKRERRVSQLASEVQEFMQNSDSAGAQKASHVVIEIQACLESAQRDKQKLEQKCREQEIDIARKERQISNLNQDQTVLLGRLYEAQPSSEGTKKCQKNQSDLGRLQQENEILKTKLDIRELNLDSKVKEIVEKDILVQKLLQEREELKEDIREQERKELQSLGRELSLSRAMEGRDSAHECASFEEVSGKIEKDMVELQTRVTQLATELDKNHDRASHLERGLERSENRCKNLEQSLEEAQDSKHETSRLIDELRLKIESQEKELKELKMELKVREGKVQHHERALEDKAKQVKEKERAFRKISTEKLWKEKEIERLEATVERMQKELKESQSGKEGNIDRLRAENLKFREHVRSLEAEVEKRDEENQGQIKQLRNSEEEMESLKPLKRKIEEVEEKNAGLEEEKEKIETELKETKRKLSQLQRDLRSKQDEVSSRDEIIRKLNKKVLQMQETMNEKDESIRREGKLRMDNMKSLDSLKIKLEKMENDDKRQRERLFNLKSACSEANEAYEIVKRQNLELKQDVQALKQKFTEKDNALEITQKEKDKLAKEILNASRTMDDMRKCSTREHNTSVSPDSALGISITSTSDLYSSGPDSPSSDSQYDDSAFLSDQVDGKLELGPNGLLSTMPNMVENFRAVVRENEVFKGKLLDLATAKEKLDKKVPDLVHVSEALKRELNGKEKAISELQDEVRNLTEDLDNAKVKLEEVTGSYRSASQKIELANSEVGNREQTIIELQESVEILEEKEKALSLYSKSVAEKFEYEAGEKRKFEQLSGKLAEEKDKLCSDLQLIDRKLQSAREGKRCFDFPSSELDGQVTMTTVEDKLDGVLQHSEEVERALITAQADYSELQLAHDRLKRESVSLDEHEKLRNELEKKEKLFQSHGDETKVKLAHLDTVKKALEDELQAKEELARESREREEGLESTVQSMKHLVTSLETNNDSYKGQIEVLQENMRRVEENSTKLANELKSAHMKQAEVEITNEAYRDENAKLRGDLLALTEAKCRVESKMSEAQRQEKKLNEAIEEEKQKRIELENKYSDVSERCDNMEAEVMKAKDKIVFLESEQQNAHKAKETMERKLMDLSNENSKLNDELAMTRKDLVELEERYLKAAKGEEELEQKLSIAALEASKLNTAYEASVKRKNTVEKNLIDLTVRSEDLEMALEKARSEKAAVMKEVCQKEEAINVLESKNSELDEERQKLINNLYFSTRKVLTMQLNLESLRNEVNVLGKEMKGLVQRAVPKKAPAEETGASENDYDQAIEESETVIQNLRQNIKSTERKLDQIRQEARVTDAQNKACQKEIDCIHKEFAFLKDQLSNFKQSCHKMSQETKGLKEELSNKEHALQDYGNKFESLGEANTVGQETIAQLQARNAELENLCNEYEGKVEDTHNDLVKRNQQIATLEANLMRTEQKKFTFEKELLVSNEKISSLELNIRSLKDENRADKKSIATLEVEYAEKQAILRDYQRTEDAHTELKIRFEELQKEKEEVTMDLSNAKEELRQEQTDLKNARREAENTKKQIWNEKNLREKVEQELNDKAEKCRAYKNNLQELQKSLTKLQNENVALEDKVKSLDNDSSSLKKETSVQTAEMKRLEDSLRELKQQFGTTSHNYEASERQRRKLTEDLLHSEERASKLQGACDELLQEKTILNEKISSMNEAMEMLLSGHEQTETSLKQELLATKKELSVTKSTLDRNQQKIMELQQEVKNCETKLKILGEKNREVLDKYWETQNQLTESETNTDSFRTEVKDLRDKYNTTVMKVAELEELLKTEGEDNERELSATNEKLIKLKSQYVKTSEERDNLKEKLQQTETALNKHSEELKTTSHKLSETEALFTNEMVQKDDRLADTLAQTDKLKQDLKKTKKLLKESCMENNDLNERLKIALEKIEDLERKDQEISNDSEDLFAEAQAKMNIINKMKAPLQGSDGFIELSNHLWMDEEDSDDMSPLPSPRPGNPITSIGHLIGSFHRTCLSAFSENKVLQEKLAEAMQEVAQLDESLQREKNDMAEVKRYLNETEKKKAKLEDEVKRLRRRLDMLKKKSIEFEREKDDEITETKGDKAALEAELWKLRENAEEMNVKLKSVEEEKERYVGELEESRNHVTEVQEEVKASLAKLDDYQENMLLLKKRIFELEATEKSLEQQIQDKEKLLFAGQQKVLEMEKLYDSCNEKKSELFTKVSKAEDKIANLQSECKEITCHKDAFEGEVISFKKNIGELEEKLSKTESALEEAKERCNDLEIKSRSQESAKDAVQHLLDVSREKNISFEEALEKQKEESECLKKELWQMKNEKDVLENDYNGALQQKENIHETLDNTQAKLRDAESSLVKTFQENEALKRQTLKLQTNACADMARQQDEIGKVTAEAESLKRELSEREKGCSDQQTRIKLLEKENEFLRKDLASLHGKQSEMKLDLTSTNSKLQSYVFERENWEREVKTVLSEMEKEKSINHSKEQRIISQRMRYEHDISFLQQKVDALERELRVMQESSEQQRHAEEISYKLAVEAKDMEIDTLRLRLQAKRVNAGDKLIVFDAMKGQLDERGKQIEELMEQMKILKESYHLELASLQADLKCSQMENLLKTKQDSGAGKDFLASNDSYNDLLESIKASRRESERLRKLLGQKMKDMRILKRQILGDRIHSHRGNGPRDLTPPPKYYGYGRTASRSLDMVPTKDQDFEIS